MQSILGIDIAKKSFDATLIKPPGEHSRQPGLLFVGFSFGFAVAYA